MPASRKLQHYANVRRERKRTRLRPRPALRRQPTMRKTLIYNRKSMTFGINSMGEGFGYRAASGRIAVACG